MCYCSFAIGQYSTLESQTERQAIELLFKVFISSDHPSITNKSRVLRAYPFCELYSPLYGISHNKLFAIFFFQTDEIFYQIILSHTLRRSLQQIND